MDRRVTRAGLLGIAAMLAVACESPEATRTRGGGPGADPQNRPAVVRMHDGSDPYWRTPTVVEGEGGDLDAARHAQSLRVPR
jgi:hypothetical protein